MLQNARVKKYMKCQRVSESKENLFSVRMLYTTLGNFRYLVSRDVDNNRKPENYPAVNAIFPAVKHYVFLQNVFKCCQKIVIYLYSFVYTFKSRYSVPKVR